MQKSSPLMTLIAVTLLLAGCFFPGLLSIAGSAGTVTQAFDFSDFDQIEAGFAFDVTILQGQDYSVVVTVNENLQRYLRVQQRGDTLSLGMESGRGYGNMKLKAEITMPNLSGLNLSGASRARFSGFDAGQDLRLELSGASSAEGATQAGNARIGFLPP